MTCLHRPSTRATCAATAPTRRMRAGPAARASRCSSSSTTRKAARTACCTATPARRPSSPRWSTAQAYANRHMTMESMYEYGSRAGVWRILREFERARAAAHRLRRRHGARAQPRAGRARSCARGHEIASHGCAGSTTRTCRRGDRARAHAPRHRDAIEELTGGAGRSAGTPAATARTRAGSSSSTAASSTTATTTATTCRSGPRSPEADGTTRAAPRRALHARRQRHALRRSRRASTPASTSSPTCATPSTRSTPRATRPARPAEDDVDRHALPPARQARPHRRAAALPRPRRRRTSSVWVARRIDIARHWRAVHPFAAAAPARRWRESCVTPRPSTALKERP